MRLEQYQSAQELEGSLGDPTDPSRPFSFQRSLELDEREEFPEELFALLARWGFHDYLVPRRVGGRRVHPLPKVRTLGVRGADISGMRLERVPLPPEALIGGLGQGLELGLKALQVSRTMCAAFSLGAGDTALRATLAWARQRELYGSRVIELGLPRRALAEAHVDYLLCDAVSVSAARSMLVEPPSPGLSGA